jgi:nucleoid-associated protein YgaU
MATLAPARWVLLGLGGGAALAGAYLFAPDLWRAMTAPQAEDVAATAPQSPLAGPSPAPLPPRDDPRPRTPAAPSAPAERTGAPSVAPGATGAPAAGAMMPAAPMAGAAAPAPQEPPRFDVVRIGARGTAVVAGRARPGAEVVLVLDGAQEIGRARADARGEWVILPAEPLAPGARELSLRARHAGEETVGPDTVIVLVPDPAPLAVAAAPRQRHAAAPPQQAMPPGGSTQPAEPRPAPAARQADAPPLPSPSPPAEPRDAAPTAAAAAEPGRAAAAGPAAPPPAAADPALTAAHPTPAPGPDERTAAPATPFAVLLPPPLPLTPAPDAAPGGGGTTEVAALPRVLQAPPPDGSAASETAAAPPSPRGAGPAPSATRLALESVEYDDSGAMRFAGTASPGAAVRVYVNQRHAGDTRADAAGRWVFTPAEPPSYGVHTLRLDQIAASGAVVARIELPFQRDRLPASAFAAPATPSETAVAAAPREATALPLSGVPPAPGDAAAGAGVPAATPLPRAGRLVVQPGHNLWRIARETYGRGVRYTIIYQANRDQIRDPHLIYPGQIFTLPASHPEASPTAPAASSRSR